MPRRDRAAPVACRRPGAAILLPAALLIVLAAAATRAADIAPVPTSLPLLPGLERMLSLQVQGRLEEAEAAGWEVLARAQREQGEGSLAAASAQMHMIAVLRLRGRSAEPETEALALRSLAIIERELGGDHLDTGRALDELASVLQDRGDLTAARRLFARKLALQERALGAGHHEVGKTANKIGMLLHELGDFEEARLSYARALSIRERQLGAKHPETIATLDNLANLALARGDARGALPLLEAARDKRRAALGEIHREVAASHSSVARCLLELGRTEDAEAAGQASLSTWRAAQGEQHWELAIPLLTLAETALRRGDARAAVAHCLQAVRLREWVHGPGHPELAAALHAQARAQLAAGDSAGALATALRVEQIGCRHLRAMARGLSQREALRYGAVRPAGLDVALTIAAATGRPRDAAAAWDALRISRAIVLEEMAARQRRVRGLGREGELINRLAACRKELAESILGGSGARSLEDYQARLVSLRRKRDALERSLAERVEEGESAPPPARPAEALPAGAALLSYVRFWRQGEDGGSEPAYAAFLLGRHAGKDMTLLVLGAAAQIDTLVANWRRELYRPPARLGESARRESRSRRAGEALRARIWDPLAAGLEGARHVFVVPDGALGLVGFEALPARGSPMRYLIETAPPLTYLTGERELMAGDGAARRGDGGRPGDGRPGAGGLLVLGEPDYDAQPLADGPVPDSAREDRRRGPCDGVIGSPFSPLPGSGQEASVIARMWSTVPGARGTATLLLGSEATETAFAGAAPDKTVLHLATHGFFWDEACAAAAGLETALLSAREAPVPDNPLAMCGLALAGANRGLPAYAAPAATDGTPDDGLLTAEEVVSLDLTGVDLVVLSACESGLGVATGGEGVLGLRRSFQIAGAAAVVMSLWPVPDDCALAWMTAFYRTLLEEGLDTASAARRASLASLVARRAAGRDAHPANWCGFIAAGRPTSSQVAAVRDH